MNDLRCGSPPDPGPPEGRDPENDSVRLNRSLSSHPKTDKQCGISAVNHYIWGRRQCHNPRYCGVSYTACV
jgi:hypothetical protein